MAEFSGFFQSMWDETLYNPITKKESGWWDRPYLSSEFRKFFSLFLGNGVFVSPTNQLKVYPGQGNTIIVSPGFAIINGGFYHNDDNLVLTYQINNTVTPRRDSVRIRYSNGDREIKAVVIDSDVEPIKGENVYDLILAELYIPAGSSTIVDANVTDKRPDEEVCGFVKGLLSVVSTNDLFSQFQSIFELWFETVKDQVAGDLAIKLQLEFEEINQNFIKYKQDYEEAFEQYKNEVNEVVNSNRNEITGFVSKYFVIPNEGTMVLTFSDKRCIINNERITADSLIDVYFTSSSIVEAEECQIYVDSYDGQIVITAGKQPATPLEAMIGVRIR